MKIRFLGQSGYILKSGNTEIIIDPYLSDSVNRVAGRPRTLPVPINPKDIKCDAVICTHNHLDHLDPFSEKIEGGFVMEFDREYTVCENNNQIYGLQIL